MKTLLSIVFTCSVLLASASSGLHSSWDSLLKKHVDEDGMVNYKGFKQDQAKLDDYLNKLSKQIPGVEWTNEAKLAYYINLYNAATIMVVLNHYPVKSIMDIKIEGKSAFDHKFIKLGSEVVSLGDVENEIIRKQFMEPRIHFALVCAAMSCPRLLNEAFTEEKLEDQLSHLTKEFLLNPEKNQVSENRLKLTKLFDWYKEDFGDDAAIRAYVANKTGIPVRENAKITFKEYSWVLNEQ